MNAKIRQTLYGLGTIGSAILTILTVWKGIDPTTASALTNAITALCGVFGIGAAGTAAVVVSKQRKDGTLETSGSPAEQIVQNVQKVIDAKSAAEAEARRIQDAVGQLAASVPVLGPLATQVLSQLPKI